MFATNGETPLIAIQKSDRKRYEHMTVGRSLIDEGTCFVVDNVQEKVFGNNRVVLVHVIGMNVGWMKLYPYWLTSNAWFEEIRSDDAPL